MADDRPHVILRHMVADDIDQVLVMDRLAFPTPWSARTYRYELSNERSTLLVLQKAPAPEEQTSRPVSDWLRRIFGGPAAPVTGQLLAYSGFWHVGEEVHISTIAVLPEWRGRKMGELLIWAMLREAARRRAEMVTLEVRVSNEIAQGLYRKYGFEVTGRRRGYYRDNSEDAFIMTAAPLDDAYQARLVELGRSLSGCLDVTFKDFAA